MPAAPISPDPEVVYAVVDASDAGRPELREQLLEMWVDVTNSGGAVDFTRPADAQAVASTLDAALDRVAAGRLLLEGLHRTAAGLGLEQLMLTTRGGTGVESFYERFGCTIVGRHPGAIRLASGDDRDELILIFRL